MTSSDLAAPLEPEVAVVLDPWIGPAYESGLRNVAAQREIGRLTDENRRLRVVNDLLHHLVDAATAEALELFSEGDTEWEGPHGV